MVWLQGGLPKRFPEAYDKLRIFHELRPTSKKPKHDGPTYLLALFPMNTFASLLQFVLKVLSCAVSCSAVFYSAVSSALAAPPEIAHIYPDSPSSSPHLIVGEGFSADATEVWCWDPKADAKQIVSAAGRLTTSPRLPASPPQEARRARPLDIEAQVVVTPLSGSVAWVKTADGWSEPYLLNVPKPFWISHKTIAAGKLHHVFGFALRARGCTIALSGTSGVTFPRITIESRSPRIADSRLVYFEVPLDAPPGDYEVWFHNGYSGAHGWVPAGRVKVIARQEDKPTVFDVRRFGNASGCTTSGTSASAAKSSARSLTRTRPGWWPILSSLTTG